MPLETVPGTALTATWTGTTGNWTDPSNWTLSVATIGGLPGPGYAVTIPGTSGPPAIAVTLDTVAEIASLAGGPFVLLQLAGGSLTLDDNSAFSGGIDIGNGASLIVAAGATLSYSGIEISGDGMLGGAGTLELGGTSAIATTLTFAIAAIDIDGGTTTLDPGVSASDTVSYGGGFTLAGATLDLGGTTLTLSGTADALSGNIEGPGTVTVTGATRIGGLSVGEAGASATIEDAGAMTQSGTLSLNGELLIDAGATYSLTAASTIAGDTATTINNGALIDHNNSGGTDTIDGAFTNTGVLTIYAADTLDLVGTASLGGTIDAGDGTLQIGGGSTTLTTTDIALGGLDITSGDLVLATGLTYAGVFTLGAGTLDLGGHTLTLSGAANALSGGIAGPGTLKVTGQALVDGLAIGLGTAAATIEDAGAVTQSGGGLGLHGELLIDAGASYTLIAATNINDAGATTINDGTLIDNSGGGISNVGGSFTNNATLTIDSGDVFETSGTATFAGLIDGAGDLAIGGGTASLTTTDIIVATLELDGGTTTLGVDLSYAGIFLGEGGTLDLNGQTLTLSGASNSLSGGALEGPGTLLVTGAADVDGLNLGAAITLEDDGTMTQSGSLSLSPTSELLIDTGATDTIATAASITGGVVVNDGTLIDADGSDGTASIDAGFTNAGTLVVDPGDRLAISGTDTLDGTIDIAGTLDLAGTGTLGGVVEGLGTLAISGGATTIATATVAALGAIDLNGGTATLAQDLAYPGRFSLDGGTLDLAGHTLTLSGTAGALSFGDIEGPGTVVVTGAASIGSLTGGLEAGSESPVVIEDAGTMTQEGPLSIDGELLVDAGATFNAAGTIDSAAIVNNGTFTVGTESTLGGNFTNNATLSAAAGAELVLDGVDALGGTIDGTGATLLIGDGQTSFATSSVGSFATIDVAGGTAALGLDLSYAGVFATEGGALDLDGYTLSLSGQSNTLAGSNFVGPGTLAVTGAANVDALNLTGSITLEDDGTVTQSGSLSLSSAGQLLIDPGGTYSFTNPESVTGGTIVNNGTLIDDSDGGTTTIASSLTSNQTLTVNAGDTLDVTGTNTLGGTIDGAGELFVDAESVTTLTATDLSIGSIVVDANIFPPGAPARGGTLVIGADLTYAGDLILQYGDAHNPGAVLNLNGHTLTLSGSSNDLGDAGVEGPGTLLVTGGLSLEGGYNGGGRNNGGLNFNSNGIGPATFEDDGTITQSGGPLYIQGTFEIDAGGSFTATAQTAIDGGSIVNNGTITDNSGGGTYVIETAGSASFTNNGLLIVDSGDTLDIAAQGTLGGTVEAAGASFDWTGALTVATTTVATFASIDVNDPFGYGASANFAVSLYYTGVFTAGISLLNLEGNTLTLTGASNSLGQNASGYPGGSTTLYGGTLLVTGATTITDVTVGYFGSRGTIEDAGTMTQYGPLGLQGTLLIDAGATYTISNPVNGESDIGENYNSSIVNNGTFIVDGGTTLIGYASGASFTSNATLTVDAGDKLNVYGATTFGGTVDGAGTLLIGSGNGNGATVTLATSNITIGAIEINQIEGGNATALGADLSYAGRFDLANNGTIDLGGYDLTLSGSADTLSDGDIEGPGTVIVTGTTQVSGVSVGGDGAAATIEDAGAMTQSGSLALNGTLLIDAEATYTITQQTSASTLDLTGSLINNGAISADGATLIIGGGLTGTGTLTVTDSVLRIDGPVSSGEQIFADPSTIYINDVARFQGTLYLSGGDQILVAGADAGSFANGLFTFTLGGTIVGTIEAPGGTSGDFSFQASGGTLDVVDNETPCFCSGTPIATNRGEIPVETLAIGDRLQTASGDLRPISWIGHRRVNCRRHPRPADIWPVRICKDAFAAGTPHQDLWLSPDHGVFAEGILVPVKYLINGTTIVQEPRDEVTYWHVELDRHDVIQAAGLPCESFLDTGNRAALANGESLVQLHADFSGGPHCEAIWEAMGCAAPRIEGAAFDRVVRRLQRGASELGFPDTHKPRRPARPKRHRTTADLASLVHPGWYLAINDDVAAAGLDPARHYTDYGRHEGRLPCPEIELIRGLGLVDPSLVIFTMPDVILAGADPIEHFCRIGWREHRRPNAYFDTGWYLATHDVPPDMNPLLHYLLTGEAQGHQPSRHFDPTWYRRRHGIGPSASPLAHYLIHRRKRRISPLPSFDAASHCQRHAAAMRPDRDAYMHHLAIAGGDWIDPAADEMKESKRFFVEKKQQKTFIGLGHAVCDWRA